MTDRLITMAQCSAAQHLAVENMMAEQHCAASHVAHRLSGAPYLATANNEPLDRHISISHTANYLVMISGASACGIDIEVIDRRVEHLASRFASSTEMALARQVIRSNPALLVWCVKEALYKMFDRQGVDFLRDLCLVSRGTSAQMLTAQAFGEQVDLQWQIIETTDKILQINTL